MKTIIVLVAVVAFWGFSSSEARIIHIPADYSTIQAGIDASANGDTVLLAPGTYVENINFGTNALLLCSDYLFDDDTMEIITTVIDGDSNNTVIYMPPSDNLGRIEGFTIRDGRAQISGGGLYIQGRRAIIKNDIITDNESIGFGWLGGGVAITENSACMLEHDRIINNKGGTGGGVYCGNAEGVIVECTIQDNEARFSGEDGWGGGGIYGTNCIIEIFYDIISGNMADLNGGGIYLSSTQAAFIGQSIIYGNSAMSGSGGALQITVTSSFVFNSIFWNNGSNEIYDQSQNSILEYCDIEHGWAGDGNISTNPLFRDSASSNFHLMSIQCQDTIDSPCIDAGHPWVTDSLLSCTWGLGTSLGDMGVYGGGYGEPLVINDPLTQIPKNHFLGQNYPNPFNSSTMISYFLSKASDVKIEIFDILGRKIETLSEGFQQAGSHQITWNADSRPTGIYFYKIQSGNFSDTKKMLLIK